MCHSGDDAAKMDVICCVVFNQRRYECCWQALLLYFLVVVRYVHTLHNNRIFATNHLTVVHLLKNVVLPGTCFFFLFFFSILAFQFISVSLTSQRRVGRNALSHCLGV